MTEHDSSPEVPVPGATSRGDGIPPAQSRVEAAAPAGPERERPAGSSRGALSAIALVAALIAAGAAGYGWWESRSRLDAIQQTLARRLSESDQAVKEAQAAVEAQRESARSIQDRVAALESKLAETQSQREEIAAVYEELARGRDDRLLAEVESALAIAAQQLQLAGNVRAALLALDNADARLARSESSQFLPLRKAISQDRENLNAVPLVDFTGMALKLESIAGAVDAMPLAFEAPVHADQASVPADPAPTTSLSDPGFWRALIHDLWSEIRQLVRIERLDRPDPALLSPQHALALRENLKLRLLNARLTLIQREERVFREDLERARAWLERYFDTQSQPVLAALSSLRQLAGADIRLELPHLTESLSALERVKAARERAGRPR